MDGSCEFSFLFHTEWLILLFLLKTLSHTRAHRVFDFTLQLFHTQNALIFGSGPFWKFPCHLDLSLSNDISTYGGRECTKGNDSNAKSFYTWKNRSIFCTCHSHNQHKRLLYLQMLFCRSFLFPMKSKFSWEFNLCYAIALYTFFGIRFVRNSKDKHNS